jgi:Domain of unknown function (DUF4150)
VQASGRQVDLCVSRCLHDPAANARHAAWRAYSDTSDGSSTVKISGEEVMLKNKSCFKRSTGDEAGAAPLKGVVTQKNTGKVYFTMWSMDVKIEGENVVRMMDLTTHNHASSMPGNSPPWPYTDKVAPPPPENDCGCPAKK